MKIYNIKNENEYEEYPPLDMEDDIYGVSASAYDCTGLMPTPPEDEAQREAYGDVYPYLPDEE